MKYKLKVYSTEWCGDCRLVKRMLTENEIPFEVVDLDKNPECIDSVGIDEMPVIVAYDGDKEISRWDATMGGVISWVRFLEF